MDGVEGVILGELGMFDAVLTREGLAQSQLFETCEGRIRVEVAAFDGERNLAVEGAFQESQQGRSRVGEAEMVESQIQEAVVVVMLQNRVEVEVEEIHQGAYQAVVVGY